jgi:predicted kinase
MIEVLVGMIGSGKSSYARHRAEHGALVICHDDLTEMLHGRYRYEPALRDTYLGMMLHLGRVAVLAGRDVVIDRTHLTREARRVWVDAARVLDVPCRAVAFPIESYQVHAYRRYQSDPRGRTLEKWLEVALHHAEQAAAEPLGPDEGFAAIVPAPDVADLHLFPIAN